MRLMISEMPCSDSRANPIGTRILIGQRMRDACDAMRAIYRQRARCVQFRYAAYMIVMAMGQQNGGQTQSLLRQKGCERRSGARIHRNRRAVIMQNPDIIVVEARHGIDFQHGRGPVSWKNPIILPSGWKHR